MIELLVQVLGRKRAWQLGRRLYMASRGEHLNRIESNGETNLVRMLLAVAGAGDRTFRAWDVGGNLGEYTHMVIEQAQRARRPYGVEIFEPAPAAIAALQERFRGDQRVRVHAMALSNIKGAMQFEVQGATAGTNTLEPTGLAGSSLIEVQVETAENFAEGAKGDEIDLIKIDAEGHDLQVIRGARGLLDRRAVKAIQFEYNFRWLFGKHLLKEAFEIAAETGYRLGIVQPRQIMFFESWQAENERFFEANYVLVRPDVAERIVHVNTRWDISNTPVTIPQVSA